MKETICQRFVRPLRLLGFIYYLEWQKDSNQGLLQHLDTTNEVNTLCKHQKGKKEKKIVDRLKQVPVRRKGKKGKKKFRASC